MIRLTGWLGILFCFVAMYMASLLNYQYMMLITMLATLFSVITYIALELQTYRGKYNE